MAWRYSRDYLKYVHQVLELGLTAPPPTEIRFCLIRSGFGEPSAAANLGQLVLNEIIPDNPNNGYSRQIRGQRITAVDTTGNVLTIPEHRRTVNQEIYFASTVNLPSPLQMGIPYFVRNPTTNTMEVAAVSGGLAVDLTTTGSGTNILKMGSTFDTGTDNREESIFDEVRFTSATNDISFQGVFAIANSGVALSSVPVSAINTSTEIITTSAPHGMSTGEPVMLTTDSGGSSPGGTSISIIYFARVLSTTTLTIHTTAADAIANTSIINITSAGSGVRLRNARGILIGWDYYPTPYTIPAGQTQRIEIPSNILNAGSLAGV
ncbi:hypothetical protein AB3R30_19865 [Leptolyngbyaceae cyanobacterium UHCC 1019]